MSKVAQEDLIAFGKAVKKARVMKELTLEELGHAVLNRDESKGYVSAIENGRRQITPRTAAKFIKHLKLDEVLLDPFLEAPEIVEDEVTIDDTKAARLLEMSKDDETAQKASEALLISLAYEFAEESHDDIFSAAQALRSALEIAARLKAQGELPNNVDAQLQKVLRKVAAHNDAGDRDAGQAELDRAFQALENEERGQKERLEQIKLAKIQSLRHAFDQAHVRSDHQLAADLIVKRLTLEARPEGLFSAVTHECNALGKAHAGQSSRFFDRVQLALSQGNLKRAKGPTKGWAYFNLAINQSTLSYQEQGVARLEEAIKSNKAAIKVAEKSNMMDLGARSLAGLSDCLQMVWERQGGMPDPQMLKAARTAHRLIMQGSDAEPKDRALITRTLASTLSNQGQGQADSSLLDESLGRYEEAMGYYADWGDDGVFYAEQTKPDFALAHLRRGRLIESMADLQAAAVGFQARAEETKDAQPYHWAIAQWNLADLALAYWEVSSDKKHLSDAQDHLNDARAMFEEGLSEFQLNKCDELQAQIDAAQA